MNKNPPSGYNFALRALILLWTLSILPAIMAHNVAGPSGVQASLSGSSTSSCPDNRRNYEDVLNCDESEFESGNSEEEGQYEMKKVAT